MVTLPVEKKGKFPICLFSLPRLKFNSDIEDSDNTNIWIYDLAL